MRSLSFVLAILLLVILAGICFAQSEPPYNYTWSEKLTKPAPLTLNGRRLGWGQAGGNYDFCAATVGDNWCISDVTGYGTIKTPNGGMVSVRFSASSQEPSCGWMPWRRGPYADGTPEAQRGPWKVGQPENAGPYPMVSMPIITHHGGDFQRYWKNGWPWQEANYFTQDGPFGQYYKRTQAMGPKRLDGSRVPLPNPDPQFSPDLTLLCAVPNDQQYVAICWVDQFGRESELSDKLSCPPTSGTNTTYLEISKRYQPPQGAVAFRVYASGRGSPMCRQPLLDRQGANKIYDWPLHLTRFYLHQIEVNDKNPTNMGGECRSWLNPIQKDIEAGKSTIHRPGKWRLFCPLILKYDSNNFGRNIGNLSENTFLSADFTASPALLVVNQRDRLLNVSLVSNSCACIASLDYSGGQAFSNSFERCTFTNTGYEGYAFVVDECSTYAAQEHSMSEGLFRNCIFQAARPIKLEAIQTAKMRFDDRCTINCTGATRYPNEVCAIEHFTSNRVTFDTIEGVNGLNNYRTFLGMYNNAGTPYAAIRDVFIDRGCSVLCAFGPNTGGIVDMVFGDKLGIYSSDRQFFRLAECPNSLNSRLSIKGLNYTSAATILSYNLNQLSIDLDRPIAEVVTPNEIEWVQRGLYLNFGGKDWTIKPKSQFVFGFSDVTNSLPRKSTLASD